VADITSLAVLRCCNLSTTVGCATGAAIAAAVLDHLVDSTHCCGLFATHYHQLSAAHAADAEVGIMHMACAVAEQAEDGAAAAGGSSGGSHEDSVAEVTFLYKLTPGNPYASEQAATATACHMVQGGVHR